VVVFQDPTLYLSGKSREPDQTQCVFDAPAMGAQEAAGFEAEGNVCPDRPPCAFKRRRRPASFVPNIEIAGNSGFGRFHSCFEAKKFPVFQRRNLPREPMLEIVFLPWKAVVFPVNSRLFGNF
jgi:hypothetical protein